jgi:acyl-CoA thioesterase-1
MTFPTRLFTAVLLSLVAFGAPLAAAEPVRIVCIGDSITQGGIADRPERTYRLPLYYLLRAEGVDVDFVGSRHAGVQPAAEWPADFDADHEGYYGARTATVRDALRVSMPTLPAADFALINLGTNDAGTDPTVTFTPPLEEIVAMLRERNPHVKIYLAEIPLAWRDWRFRWEAWSLARRLGTPASPVVTVDLHTGWFARADTFDGVHPNPEGQLKMARRWLAHIRPALPAAQADGVIGGPTAAAAGDAGAAPRLLSYAGARVPPALRVPLRDR